MGFGSSIFKFLKSTKDEIQLYESKDVRDKMLATMFVRQTILWCALWGVLTVISFKML